MRPDRGATSSTVRGGDGVEASLPERRGGSGQPKPVPFIYRVSITLVVALLADSLRWKDGWLD